MAHRAVLDCGDGRVVPCRPGRQTRARFSRTGKKKVGKQQLLLLSKELRLRERTATVQRLADGVTSNCNVSTCPARGSEPGGAQAAQPDQVCLLEELDLPTRFAPISSRPPWA